jgi:hypothetical protein
VKSKILLLALLNAISLGSVGCDEQVFAATPSISTTGQQVKVDVNVFHDRLAVSGRWFSHEKLGWVWAPYDVSAQWRPYTVGHWVYTGYGWTWDSDEEWGWATYHYGRWYFDANFGWIWIPGTEWGPAWVSWRFGDGWVGWAPLPPEAVWDVSGGLSVSWFDIDEFIPPHWYCFVEEKYLAEIDLRERIVQSARNVTLVNVTRNITRYELSGGHVISRSIDAERIEKDTGATINRYRLVDVNSPSAMHQGRVGGNEIAFYRPTVSKSSLEQAPYPPQSNQTRPPGAARNDLVKRQEEGQRQLERQQKAESEALKEQHRQELAHPPAGVSLDELGRQHEAEQCALEEKARRERQLLENWHSMERYGGVTPERHRN